MSNVWVIARKEFSDLANSRLVILVLAFYVLIFLLSFNNYYGSSLVTSNLTGSFISNTVGDTLSTFTTIICYYGGLVSIILGFSSMSSEADGKALNTLLIKPLYRDTIINGKLLGAICFMSCIFWVSAAFYLTGLLFLFGGMVGSHLLVFLGLLPLAFILYMLCSLFFFSLSVLICISFKEQSFALFLGFLSWVVLFDIMPNTMFVGYISDFLHLDQSMSNFLSSLSPRDIVALILGQLVNKKSLSFIVSNDLMQFFILLLYCLIAVIASYSLFIRRDVS